MEAELLKQGAISVSRTIVYSLTPLNITRDRVDSLYPWIHSVSDVFVQTVQNITRGWYLHTDGKMRS